MSEGDGKLFGVKRLKSEREYDIIFDWRKGVCLPERSFYLLRSVCYSFQ